MRGWGGNWKVIEVDHMEQASAAIPRYMPAWAGQANGETLIEESAFRDLIYSLPVYFYHVRYSGGSAQSVYHSPQSEMVTGYSPADYQADPFLWLTMVHPEDRELVREFFSSLKGARFMRRHASGRWNPTPVDGYDGMEDERGYTLEHRILRKDGAVRWIVNRCVLARDDAGRPLRMDGMVLDVTEQKNAERMMAERLLREEELVHHLEGEKKRAEEAVEQNNRLMSLVVHDLRSPVTSVLSFLKLLESGRCGEIGQEGRDIVNRMLGINESMLLMIEDLLSISRIKGGGLRPHPVFLNIGSLIASVCELHQYQAEKKGVELACKPAEGRLYADHTLVMEVLGNLVFNAIKFCKQGDRITLSTRSEGGKTILSVSDTGPGIKAAFLPNLFSYAALTTSPGSAGERGTGFGLPLCAEIMHMHGGELRVVSEEGKGSIFEAEFPEVIPSVLVVDDDPDRRALIEIGLKLLNVRLSGVQNGHEAWAALQGGEFHLVLSDLRMPVMDGCELLQQIRQHPAMAGMRFIAITSSPDTPQCQEVLRLGADDFIKMPASIEELIPRVRRFTA